MNASAIVNPSLPLEAYLGVAEPIHTRQENDRD